MAWQTWFGNKAAEMAQEICCREIRQKFKIIDCRLGTIVMMKTMNKFTKVCMMIVTNDLTLVPLYFYKIIACHRRYREYQSLLWFWLSW